MIGPVTIEKVKVFTWEPMRWTVRYGTRTWFLRNAFKHLIWGNFNRLRWAINGHFAEQGAALGGCENCGSFYGVHQPGSMTCYVWDPKSGEPDPNKVWLCTDCAEDYEEYWSDRWAEYNSGRL
ncbi:hypothetical protein BAJUN_03160 [Bajunvirus bajun]|uniref:Uncharacterized protein n=1 Tax=Brevundimonas phage vB_BgoS-Bajun TaxID=2948594 RepID=A0A9E7N4V0_9CAUD|nr:hypothetical protein BAJUN_03160 [Brevundimonas phage vB_BgoS-Bajun]